jgi:hypothetical protein
MAMNPMHANENMTTPLNAHGIRARIGRLALVLALAFPLASFAAEQRTFDTPEAAVDALTAALKANDEAGLVALIGEEHKSCSTCRGGRRARDFSCAGRARR